MSLDKDFSLSYPYTKYLGVRLLFAGPIQDTRWKEYNDSRNHTNQNEEVVKDLETKEVRALVNKFLSNVYDKACNFKSDKI